MALICSYDNTYCIKFYQEQSGPFRGRNQTVGSPSHRNAYLKAKLTAEMPT